MDECSLGSIGSTFRAIRFFVNFTRNYWISSIRSFSIDTAARLIKPDSFPHLQQMKQPKAHLNPNDNKDFHAQLLTLG